MWRGGDKGDDNVDNDNHKRWRVLMISSYELDLIRILKEEICFLSVPKSYQCRRLQSALNADPKRIIFDDFIHWSFLL